MRLEIESKRGSGLVPHTIVVAGNHPKGISPRRNVGVVSDSAAASGDPVGVEPFELVFELDLVGGDKAQAGIVERESAATG